SETPIRRSISPGARRLEIFPLRPSVITCGCSHSSRTSEMAPALRAAATRRCNSHAAPYSTVPRSTTSSSFIAWVLSSLICPLLTSFRSDDPLDLGQVIEIVPGHHANNVLDGFDAALGVHAVMLPLLRRKRFQKREVRFPRRAELCERFARVPFFVMARRGPAVLVKRLNGRSGRAQDLPHPPARNDLAVREMREDFSGGPFSGRGPFAQLRRGSALDQPPQLRRCDRLEFQGILPAQLRQHSLG